MIGQQLGPYTIESELGSGGMGTVYRATGPDGFVAIKIVHPHLLDSPGFFKRFLREAEIGKKVDHPNVVRTLDCDALGSHHFLVTEYVEGKSLRDMLADLGTIPESLLREIARQTAAGLAAIHEAGIIHRDLKPENVLITDDHEIRIMDLGVAKLAEATIELTREGQFAGSLLYAAPEQFRGDLNVGPAADLYALGVLLYELASGRNPFQRDDAAQVIDAHLHHDPQRLDKTSRFFAELTSCLLSKDPNGRLESASNLSHVLEEAERATWWIELAPELDRQPIPRIRVRQETELHGRNEDTALLRKAWEQAKQGNGNTVWIDGEAGIGKTRLLADFVQSIEDDSHVLYGSYPPSGGLGGFSDAILDHFGEVGLEERLKPYLSVTPSLVPAFAALVKHDSHPRGAEEIQGDVLNAVGVHLMRGLATEKPTVWLVDDLHFAPKESRDLALALARAVGGCPVLAVYTARPGVPEEELAHFERLENFQRVGLTRLDRGQIEELLTDLFHSGLLAERLGTKLAEKSDGVPFFLFEMIRVLSDSGIIKQESDGSYIQMSAVEDIEVPSAVKDLIEGRLRALTEDQRAILDAGAVQGMTFDPALVALVLEEKRVRVLRSLAEIQRRSGLVRDDGELTIFDQNQIQEVVYQALPTNLRTAYHTLLAEAHASRCGEVPDGDDAVFLAHHQLRGGRPEAAIPHLEAALGHLGTCHRNQALLDLAQRALKAKGLLEGSERVDVLLRQADRFDLLGRRDEQRAAIDEAIGLADETDDGNLRGQAQRSLGQLLIALSEHDAAQAALRKSLDLAHAAGDKRLEGQATGNLGVVFCALGRYAEAQEQFERHRALAREIEDRRGEAGATCNLGFVFSDLARYAEAKKQCERARALFREIGDRRGEASATGILGNVYLSLGCYAEAKDQYERHRALAREIGDRRGETIVTGNLGNVFSHLGCLAQAQEHHERARALAREIGDRRSEANATCNLGFVFSDFGRYAEAKEQHERAHALFREIGDRRGEAIAAGNLGHVFSVLGSYAEAQEQLERSRNLARETGDRQGEAIATGNLGVVFSNLGQYEEAQKHLERRRALAREFGDRRGEARAIGNLGLVFSALGRLAEAQEHYEKQRAVARELGDRSIEGEALHGLAGLSEARGEVETAAKLYEKSLGLHRELGEMGSVAEALVSVGRLAAARNEIPTARTHLDEAFKLARETKRPVLILAAIVERARLPDGDSARALAAVEHHEEHTDHRGRMSARFRLWELTHDKAHLEEAKRLLDFALEHTREEYRAGMIENVPLHRDIMLASQKLA